ncbi:hypothetical protein JCM8202_005282 [Rhodotorula sphaerocarpa]
MPARAAATSAAPAVPRYRSASHAYRLPPAKLPLFRSVVAHPPAPWAAQQQQNQQNQQEKQDAGAAAGAKGKGKGKADKSTTAAATSAAPPRPHAGPSTLLFSPAPRPLIPLTTSPMNHKLWNPPAEGSGGAGGAGVAERDESGRLAKFEKRFGDAFGGFGGPEASDAAGAAGAGAGAAGAAGAAARAAKAQEEMYRGLMEGDGTGRALGQVVGKEHLQKAKRVKPQKGRR